MYHYLAAATETVCNHKKWIGGTAIAGVLSVPLC